MKVEGANGGYIQPKVNAEKQAVDNVAKDMKQENIKVNTKRDLTLDEKLDMPEYIPTVGEKTIIEAIEKANKKLDGALTEFRFSVHDATKQISVKVLNKDTGETIREIPPEKILDMVAKMWEMAGILIDERR